MREAKQYTKNSPCGKGLRSLGGDLRVDQGGPRRDRHESRPLEGRPKQGVILVREPSLVETVQVEDV